MSSSNFGWKESIKLKKTGEPFLKGVLEKEKSYVEKDAKVFQWNDYYLVSLCRPKFWCIFVLSNFHYFTDVKRLLLELPGKNN